MLSVVRYVTTAENVVVPPMEEIIVDAYVDRSEKQEGEEESWLLLAIHPNLPGEYGCVLTPLVVDVAINTMVSVHVFNQHSYLMVIRQDPTVGQVEPVELVSTILRCENPNERDIFSAARKVQLRQYDKSH